MEFIFRIGVNISHGRPPLAITISWILPQEEEPRGLIEIICALYSQQSFKPSSFSSSTYLRKVRSVPDPFHHLLALGVNGRHVGPHPLPGHALNGETGPVDVEQDPSVLVFVLPGRPGHVVWGRCTQLLLGAAAQETVSTGALGAAVPAQFGRGGPGPTGWVWSRHRLQEEEMLER